MVAPNLEPTPSPALPPIPPVDLVWLRGQLDAPLEVPDLQLTPDGYQRVGAAAILCTPGMVLTDDPGLGKSAQVIMAIRWLVEAGYVNTVLLVAPSKLLYQWESEFAKWVGDSLRVRVIDGDPRQRTKAYEHLVKSTGHPLRHVHVAICSYGTVRVDHEKLAALGLSMIAGDEASMLRNPDAAVTKAFKTLAHTVPRRLLITATPVQIALKECQSLIAIVAPEAPLADYERFLRRYCSVIDMPIKIRRGAKEFTIYKKTITGYRALDFFKDDIQPYVFGRTIEELAQVGVHMPEIIVGQPGLDRWVDLTDDQRARYDEIEQGILSLDGDSQFLEALERCTRLQQVPIDLRLVYPDAVGKHINPSAKLTELRELLTGELSGRQVVVFSKYLEFLKIGVLPLLEELQLSTAEIHGGIDGKTAERNKEAFQAGDRQIAVITTAGEMGLNLDAASEMVCCDLLVNPGRMTQIYARIRRRSSAHASATIYRLLARDTIEERILQLLESRGALIDWLDSPERYDEGSMQALRRLVNRQIPLVDAVERPEGF